MPSRKWVQPSDPLPASRRAYQRQVQKPGGKPNSVAMDTDYLKKILTSRVYEIALETPQPIPAIFTHNGNYVIASVKKNNEILYAPIPKVAWQQLKASGHFLQEKLEQLGTETGIDLGALK